MNVPMSQTGQDLHRLYDAMIADMYAVGNTQILSSAYAMKLERVEALLRLLDNPQTKFKSIHIGGTSGKGSTSTAVSAYLTAAGYKTGLFLSPHIQIMNERIQIDNYVIPTTEFNRLWQKIKPLVIQVGEELPVFGRPSFFEISVALCYEWFAQQQIDVAVVEVGLGGTLDATNVLPASIAAITSIGLDHTEILGDTVELIAQDKAGIIKKGQIVVVGEQEKNLQEIFARKCEAVGAELRLIQYTNQAYDDDLFYIRNIELAKEIVLAFDPHFDVSLFDSVSPPRPPGRLEKMQDNPLVILDGAHNPQKMQSLVTVIKKDPTLVNIRWTVVTAVKEHKNSIEMFHILHQLPINKVFATKFNVEGGFFFAQEPNSLVEQLTQEGLQAEVVETPLEAITRAVEEGQPVLVTGSLYLLDEVRSYWTAVDDLLLQAESGLKGTLEK